MQKSGFPAVVRYYQLFAPVEEKLTAVVIEEELPFEVRAVLEIQFVVLAVLEIQFAVLAVLELCFQGLVLNSKRAVVAQKVNCRHCP